MTSGPIIDAGTGTGAFAAAWITAGGSTDLILLDPSPSMLARASDRLRERCVTLSCVQASINVFKPVKPVAAVLAAHVVEQCPDPAVTLKQMAAWLAPEGRLYLVISKPHVCNWLLWPKFRHRWFTEEQVITMANAADLQHHMTYSFSNGPPRRTSLGYIFKKSGKV